MKKVIFILSVGHSGSTLLDITLGQFSNTFSTGELKHLTWQYYRRINNLESTQKCTCGNDFDNCEVWAKVFKNLAAYRNIHIKEIPEKLSIKHLDSLSFFEDPLFKKILRFVYKWSLHFSLLPSFLFRSFFKKTNENNVRLYKSIFDDNKSLDYIIDSSKDIIRFNELRKSFDVFPIILVRDINERMKSKWVKESKRTEKQWAHYYNHLLPIIKKMDEKDYHIVSYDRFISNPKIIIEDLSKKININSEEFSKKIPMQNYHVVAGGGMRYTDEVNIILKDLNEEKHISALYKSGLDTFFVSKL